MDSVPDSLKSYYDVSIKEGMQVTAMREGFVYLDEAVQDVKVDARYFGTDNFTGDRVDGYHANRAVGTVEMAAKLSAAADAAKKLGLGLLIWDAYRPTRAVRRFMEWAEQPEDGKTRQAHYPHLQKTQLIPLGYISERSGHSRGSTVDLSLYDLASGQPLDMGGDFDLMDEVSHHHAAGISALAEKNRDLLMSIMCESGFAFYENEWWHYTLLHEPYPDTYFDFEIE